MHEIATVHFRGVKKYPCRKMYRYPKVDVDLYIAGWTKYWNDIFKPKVLLDPTFVKALIASESSFNIKVARKDGSGQGYARGLLQVTDTTRKILADEHGELKDHYITLTKEDALDPNLNIAAGVRWLFHKRRLAESRLGKNISWLKVVEFYKGAITGPPKRRKELMGRFESILKKFATCA
jgi:soluble lytic murein transglycosylase-like protein